jgi:hypothetical protein
MSVHWTWWRWQNPALTDGWRIYLFEETDTLPGAENTLFYHLAIGAPGGVELDLGRVPRPIQIDYGYADHPPTYSWTVDTAYGAWELFYREDWPCGRLTLNVYASRHAGHWAELTLRDLPARLVAELGACLVLPPTEWHLREGWMSKDEVGRAVQAVADTTAE